MQSCGVYGMIQKVSKASEHIAGGTDCARLRASFLEREVYINSYLNVLQTASAIALCLEFWMQPQSSQALQCQSGQKSMQLALKKAIPQPSAVA